MSNLRDRAASEPDVENLDDVTPPNKFSAGRPKRKRDDAVTTTELASFKEEIRSMIASMMATQLSEIRKNTEKLTDIQQTNKNIEDSVIFLSEQYEDFRNKINSLENQIAEDKQHIQNLEQKIEDIQRESRKTCIEIKNVPRKPKESKEDLLNMVITLSNTIKCPLQKGDIRDIYRVRSKQEGKSNTPIIVEMGSTMVKNEILRTCKAHNIKHKGNLSTTHLGIHSVEPSSIFVAEQLTARASRLYFLARELKRRKIFEFCWTNFGRVYLRKSENSQIIHIVNESQLERLGKENPLVIPAVPACRTSHEPAPLTSEEAAPGPSGIQNS